MRRVHIGRDIWFGSAPDSVEQLTEFAAVAFCARENQAAADLAELQGKRVVRVPLVDVGDRAPSSLEVAQACEAARSLAGVDGAVIATCVQGVNRSANRSAFVAALTLMYRTGCAGDAAVMAVLQADSWALTNRGFRTTLSASPSPGEKP